jgi:hypothetical protein
MLAKLLNTQGQKAYQRADREDRSLPYRDWVRTIDADGFFIDIDFIKWRCINGELTPVAITDITRCDSEEAGQPYLDAITSRVFVRDRQGDVLRRLGELLKIPVYLVLFQKEIKWFWVYSFQSNRWKRFLPGEWATFLKEIK